MANKKASDEELIKSYQETNNIWKTAEKFNMCGQTVHERLTKLGVIHKINTFTDADKLRVIEVYKKGFKTGDGTLDNLAKELNRTKQFICRKAKELGLTNASRKECKSRIKEKKEYIMQWYKNNEHPKGMLGKHHTLETKQKLSVANKKAFLNKTEEEEHARIIKGLITKQKNNKDRKRNNVSWKQGKRTIADKIIFFRSSWEYNYALYLQYLKETGQIKEWSFENKLFLFDEIKSGCVSYRPDFEVIRNDNTYYYVEIKGWLDDKSKTRFEYMNKYYPDVELVIISGKEYKLFKSEWIDKLKNFEK